MPPAEPTRSGHALARSIRSLAIGVVRDMGSRSAGAAVGAVAEREEQFQIAVSGSATDYPAWASAFIAFETRFTIATGDRHSGLQRPQAYLGCELTSVQRTLDGVTWSEVPDAVFLTAVVREFHFNDDQMIDGATVAVGAMAPGDDLRFTGFVHLSVQGYGAPSMTTDEAG